VAINALRRALTDRMREGGLTPFVRSESGAAGAAVLDDFFDDLPLEPPAPPASGGFVMLFGGD